MLRWSPVPKKTPGASDMRFERTKATGAQQNWRRWKSNVAEKQNRSHIHAHTLLFFLSLSLSLFVSVCVGASLLCHTFHVFVYLR